MNRTILITGANGFVGHHVGREFKDNGYKVIGVGQDESATETNASILDQYIACDLSSPEDVASRIDFSGVDAVLHLAGLAAVGPSFDSPLLYITANIGMEINLYETALSQKQFPRFVVISSGSLYDAKAELPITESSPVLPSSPYAVSKLGQEQMAKYYNNRAFESIIARPFNHIGPGQGPGFIVPDIAKQLVDVERKAIPTVMVGNLDAQRDYTDVRDIAVAYRLLIEKGQAGHTYNICSGTPRSGNDILAGLKSASGIQAEIAQDPAKMRPADTPVIFGSHDKITEHTGWQPSIPLETTLKDVIADWRSK